MANSDIQILTTGAPSAAFNPETIDLGGQRRMNKSAPSKPDGTPVNPATSDLQAAGNSTLATLLTTAQAQLTAIQAQRVETIWTDDTGVRFIRVDIGGAIVWTDVAGNASSAPGTGARPDNDSGSAVDRQTFRAIASGTGYVSGDFISHFTVADESGDPVGNFWLNITAGTKIAAPSSANLAMVSALPDGAATDAKLELIRLLLAAAAAGQPTFRPPITYTAAPGFPKALGASWGSTPAVTVTSATRGLRVAPIAAATAYDIEWTVVPTGAAAPTDTYGEPIQGGEDFAAGLPLGDLYLRSASSQVAIVKLGV